MPGHNGNGGRAYLAEEVRAQANKIDALGGKVADIDKRVEGQTVALTQLIESEHRAHAQRSATWEAINAMRGELGQVMISITGAQAELGTARKAIDAQNATLTQHESERQRRAGALELAKAVGKPAWAILSALGAAALAVGGFLAAWFAHHTAPPGGH